MKNLMRILSVLIAFCGIVILLSSNFNLGDSFNEFAIKISLLATLNIAPIISIALCAFCLERNDSNYFTRIIPIYMTVPIVISTFLMFFNLGSDVAEFLAKVLSFFSSTYLCITTLSVLFIIKPNNQITKIIKILAYLAIAICVVFAIIIQIKSFMVEKLPNVYEYEGYGGFNFSSVATTESIANKVYQASVMSEIFLIILLFTTNYAFSEKIDIDYDEIDYERIKKEATDLTNTQMQNIYNPVQEKEKSSIPNGTSMNINSQLGLNSNVGKVKEAAKEVNVENTSMDIVMPLSGPVINESIKQEEKNNAPVVNEINQNNQSINNELKTVVNQTQESINQINNSQN